MGYALGLLLSPALVVANRLMSGACALSALGLPPIEASKLWREVPVLPPTCGSVGRSWRAARCLDAQLGALGS